MFYTYLWLREDGVPYYVGKGHNYRAFRSGHPPKDRILVEYFPDEESAFLAERFLISYYGRLDIKTGPLINRTGGGQGQKDRVWKPSQAHRERVRAFMMGRRHSVGNHAFRGHKQSVEAKEKIRQARTGNTPWNKGIKTGPNPEHSLRMTGRPSPRKGTKCSIETRAKMSRARMGKIPWNKGSKHEIAA